MKQKMKFIKANVSAKNGKTYVEVLNPNTYGKTIHELTGAATVNGLSTGEDVTVTFQVGGEGFKHFVSITELIKG